MRAAAVILFTFTTFMFAAKAASVDELFSQFGLYGTWARDCASPAAPANPYVRISTPTPGVVLEQHDLGAHYALNKYSVLAAEKMSATELAVDVIFQPGAENQEREKLVFQIRDGTRRTMFNQPEGGEVLVKGGIALARGAKTPMLRKCE